MTAAAERAPASQGWRAAYGRALEWLVIALVVALALEVTLGVVFRSLGRALTWYDEIASAMLAWLTFYGSALASFKRAHIGCPEIVDRMPWRVRRAFNIAAQVLVIAFFVLLGGVGAWILPVLATDTLVSLPSVPVSTVQSVIPISAVLIVIAESLHLRDLLRAAAPAAAASGVTLADGLH